MTLREFVNSFNSNSPDFTVLPPDFPNCDTDGLGREELIKFSVIKTLWELHKPNKTQLTSRVWKDPKGYEYLAVWQNAALLRILIRKFTLTLPLNKTLNQPLEYRLKTQMDDAARSVKRNIEEGWKRPTTSEYLTFLGYSQSSLAEVRGDIIDSKTDGFLRSIPGSSLKNIGIDLNLYKGPLKGQFKGEPTDSPHPYAKPLTTLNPKTLTYEIFMELINKTDYLLLKLIASLEMKLDNDQQHYKLEQARIKSNLHRK